ncbi:MAG: hypothetical protein L6V93_12715 [Clostridiales bacterium]|nr:MAG: hypothetical protein L6V93_12715 [Clostridiales bacterium]
MVALIVVIVVAAIAASPFGIFISDEAADNDSIPFQLSLPSVIWSFQPSSMT